MDIAASANGDIALDVTGFTQLSLVEAIGQRVDHILRSKPGDWNLDQGMGAYVAQYVGYPNTPATKTLIETEVLEELQADYLVSAFPIEVEYTPTSINTGMLEIVISLPDGTQTVIHRDIAPAQSINTSDELPYTPPSYNAEAQITRTELVQLTEESNVFEVSYLPINSEIFIKDYNESLGLNEDGILEMTPSGVSQTIDLTGAYISGQLIPFGDLPSGMLTQRDFIPDYIIQDVLESKMIQTIDVFADDIELDKEDYNLNSSKLSLRLPYTEYIDGEVITHGVESPPSGSIKIDISYYESERITSIDSFEQDSAPNNVYPRYRLAERNFITTKRLFEPGTYFVQYLSYELEV